MCCAERALGVGLVDDDRDVALRRALRDRTEADARLAERTEELGRDAGLARHAFADHGEYAAAARHVDALDLPVMPLGEERPFDGIARLIGLRRRNAEADRVARAAL